MRTTSLQPRLVATPEAFARVLVDGHLWVTLSGPDGELPRTLEAATRAHLEAERALRLATGPAVVRPVDTIGGMQLIASGDGASASRMLAIRNLFPDWPLGGVLAGVPSPDQFMCVPVHDLGALDALDVLATATRFAYEAAKEPLSDQMFWHDGRSWHPVAVTHRDDDVEVDPPLALRVVLSRLAALAVFPLAAEA